MTSLIDAIKSLATLGNVLLLIGSLGGLYAFYIKIKNGIYAIKADVATAQEKTVATTISTESAKINNDMEAYNAALAKFNSDPKSDSGTPGQS